MYNFTLVNLDTDSLSICKPDGSPFSEQEKHSLLKELNSLMLDKISWENDGYFSKVLIVKAKNYCLLDEKGKLKIKGSSLVASMKEPALQEFIKLVIDYLLNDKKDQLIDLYHKYIIEIHNLTNINRWSSKKTLTYSVLNPERTNEQKVFDAIKGKGLQEGDKFWVYFVKDESLKLPEDWSNDHCTTTLMSKLYKTLEIFETVLDMTQFTKFTLKSHQVRCDLADLLGLEHPEKQKRTRKIKESVV